MIHRNVRPGADKNHRSNAGPSRYIRSQRQDRVAPTMRATSSLAPFMGDTVLFPLRATVSSRRLPVFTIGLLLANVVAFWHEVNLPMWEVQPFIARYGAIPARFAHFDIDAVFSLITNMFLHISLTHLLGNLWFLWIFGDDVEGRMGRFRFLTFYFVSGLCATTLHVLANVGDITPCIGASGAIYGVLGAYLYLFPTSTIKTAVFVGPVPRIVEIPAGIFLGVKILIDVVSAMTAEAGAGGTAWFAHIGGFSAGLLLAMGFTRKT